MRIKDLRLSQKARNGGLSNPIMPKNSSSWVYICKSQCFAFQRPKASLKRFMSGLRDLFVWKQKATTDAPDTHNA